MPTIYGMKLGTAPDPLGRVDLYSEGGQLGGLFNPGQSWQYNPSAKPVPFLWFNPPPHTAANGSTITGGSSELVPCVRWSQFVITLNSAGTAFTTSGINVDTSPCAVIAATDEAQWLNPPTNTVPNPYYGLPTRVTLYINPTYGAPSSNAYTLHPRVSAISGDARAVKIIAWNATGDPAITQFEVEFHVSGVAVALTKSATYTIDVFVWRYTH